MKGLVEKEVPWIFWLCCIAHKIGLAFKDALKGTAFHLIKLYYMYEKSPKKCRQLEEIICDLKDCLKFDDKGVSQYEQVVQGGLCTNSEHIPVFSFLFLKIVLSKLMTGPSC